jgi:hypothetical protein
LEENRLWSGIKDGYACSQSGRPFAQRFLIKVADLRPLLIFTMPFTGFFEKPRLGFIRRCM